MSERLTSVRTKPHAGTSIAIDGGLTRSFRSFFSLLFFQGSGKSTLLRMLKKQYQQISSSEKVVCFATERTHEWKAMLPMYYQDTGTDELFTFLSLFSTSLTRWCIPSIPERWSFPFQMQVLLSHIRNFQEAIRQKVCYLFYSSMRFCVTQTPLCFSSGGRSFRGEEPVGSQVCLWRGVAPRRTHQ